MIPRNLNSLSSFGFISLILLGLAPCLLSAATINDLEFTLINGDTEYSVSVKDTVQISGALNIPASHNGKPVTEIGSNAMGGSFLFNEYKPAVTSVTIPSSIKVIRNEAFYNCLSLTSVTFAPSSQLTTIGDSAFNRCKVLTSIDLPDSITSLGDTVFGGCAALTSIDLSQTAVTHLETTFSGCSTLTSVLLPDSLTNLVGYVFSSCAALASIEIPQSVTTIGPYTFSNCSALTSIEIPQGVTSIGESAFDHCSALTAIDLSKNALTTLEGGTFSSCTALASIKLPPSVTTIGPYTFPGCSALTSIEIPQGVTSIGESAFYQCYNLASVIFLGPAPSLEAGVFLDTGRDVGGFTITVYEAHEASYASWSTSYTYNVVPDPIAEPVILLVSTHYNPTSKTLGIITSNEASFGTLSLQHTASLADAWTTLSTLAYIQATDSTSGAVTRTVTINPDTQITGFYRLVSTD